MSTLSWQNKTYLLDLQFMKSKCYYIGICTNQLLSQCQLFCHCLIAQMGCYYDTEYSNFNPYNTNYTIANLTLYPPVTIIIFHKPKRIYMGSLTLGVNALYNHAIRLVVPWAHMGTMGVKG